MSAYDDDDDLEPLERVTDCAYKLGRAMTDWDKCASQDNWRTKKTAENNLNAAQADAKAKGYTGGEVKAATRAGFDKWDKEKGRGI
jgi:hypothetical protein